MSPPLPPLEENHQMGLMVEDPPTHAYQFLGTILQQDGFCQLTDVKKSSSLLVFVIKEWCLQSRNLVRKA